ncbi:hypothetical protein FHR75_002179 [Kineococcus radiotolerans]|uniref:Histidine kinase/HSP90-like ATPase domain-containing protein n=1 Tax=Kineococcus radiotolerans TaxID=131568 RepID=A0A7W4TN85_KINRA|nr:ATP-binding protein [Kineococcus radiotolerans]MBB2901391.1 hypothetical protein [Kineococcus radiotolerans]
MVDRTAELVTVRLLGLPLALRGRFLRYHEDLLRELALIQIGRERGPASTLPQRLLSLADELARVYAPFRAQPAAALDAAAAAGRASCDVTYTVPVEVAPLLRQVGDVLEEADDFCRAEQHLLTLPAPPEVVAYRRWVFGEFARQLAGEEPRPWRPADASEPPPPPPVPPPPPGEQAVAAGAAPGETPGRLVGPALVLDPLAGAVSAARRHVRRAVAELHVPEVEESAELGVSELVTNALLHARTAFTITVRSMPTGTVRIEVSDSSPLPAQQRHLGLGATTGRGLRLVEAVSSAWGVDPLASGGVGKTVWFEPRPSTGEDPGSEVFAAEAWAEDLQQLL